MSAKTETSLIKKPHHKYHSLFERGAYASVLDEHSDEPIVSYQSAKKAFDSARPIHQSLNSAVRLTSSGHIIKSLYFTDFFQKIRRGIRLSRAYNNWYFASKLEEIGIKTPRVLGYYEKKCFGFKLESFVIFEYVDAITLSQYLETATQDEQIHAATSVMNIMRTLKDNRLVHGDTRPTNWMVNGSGQFILIDLDGMRDDGNQYFKRSGAARDLKKIRKLFKPYKDALSYVEEVIASEWSSL